MKELTESKLDKPNLKLSIAYLLWLTEENYDRRWPIVSQSCETFLKMVKTQSNCDAVIINNGTIIPNNIKEFPVLSFQNRYLDIALHYSAVRWAQHVKSPYFMFCYDDFVYFNERKDLLLDAINFMEEEKIPSMRVPSYKIGDQRWNTSRTSKQVNPDSVRHELGANGIRLFQKHGRDEFYKTNWYPNSRPMIWNTDHFLENYVLINESHPVMQPYEGYVYRVADKLAKQDKYISSFMNGGICSTFNLSERTRTPGCYGNTKVNTKLLMNEIAEQIKGVQFEKISL